LLALVNIYLFVFDGVKLYDVGVIKPVILGFVEEGWVWLALYVFEDFESSVSIKVRGDGCQVN